MGKRAVHATLPSHLSRWITSEQVCQCLIDEVVWFHELNSFCQTIYCSDFIFPMLLPLDSVLWLFQLTSNWEFEISYFLQFANWSCPYSEYIQCQCVNVRPQPKPFSSNCIWPYRTHCWTSHAYNEENYTTVKQRNSGNYSNLNTISPLIPPPPPDAKLLFFYTQNHSALIAIKYVIA